MNNVAVLLASHNGEKYIEEQIHSILRQKSVKSTIYISDDKSTDKTLSICYNLKKKFPNIKIFPNEKRFGNAARNFFNLISLISADNYEYIALSDQDDIWVQNKLCRAISTIENLNVDGYSSDIISFDSIKKQKYIKKSYSQKKYDYMFEAPGPGCSFVIKKDSFLFLQTFIKNNSICLGELNYHDWFIYAFFRANGLKWHIDCFPSLFYRQHDNNVLGANNSLNAFHKRLFLIRDGAYRKEIDQIGKLTHKRNIDRKFMLSNVFSLRRKSQDCFYLLILVLLGILR